MMTEYKVTIYSIGAAGLVLSILYFASVLRASYQFFEVRGIKHPKPVPVLGQLHSMLTENLGELTQGWVRDYGRITGFFYAWSPRLLIADPETINQVCIKDFDTFTDHFATVTTEKHQAKFLYFLEGDRWRKIRAFMSPTFTSAKIRRMYKMLDICADDLVCIFREQLEDCNNNKNTNHAIIDLHDQLSLYTMDAIATCCYGMRMVRAKGMKSLKSIANRDEFVRICLPVFSFSKIRLFFAWILPKSIQELIGFTPFSQDVVDRLAAVISKLLETRQNVSRTKNYDDYLQLLIDSRLDDEMYLDNVDQAENHHASLSHESLKADQQKHVDSVLENEKKSTRISDGNNDNIIMAEDIRLSQMEMLSNAMFLMVTAVDTTAGLLTSCLYALSHHPEVQDRLYREIKAIAEFDTDKTIPSFDYGKLTANKYLDAVISESLRLEPIAIMVDRKANHNYHFEKWNFSIPKGSVIFLAIHAVQHDPQYWPEPEKFDPDRFMPENRHKIIPGSYCPFGIGPRHCVGMRFSLTETKLAIAKLISQFRFEPAPGIGYPGKTAMGATIGTVKLEDPRVILKPR